MSVLHTVYSVHQEGKLSSYGFSGYKYLCPPKLKLCLNYCSTDDVRDSDVAQIHSLSQKP